MNTSCIAGCEHEEQDHIVNSHGQVVCSWTDCPCKGWYDEEYDKSKQAYREHGMRFYHASEHVLMND